LLEPLGNPVINEKRSLFHQSLERGLIGRRVLPLEAMQGQAVLAAAAARTIGILNVVASCITMLASAVALWVILR